VSWCLVRLVGFEFGFGSYVLVASHWGQVVCKARRGVSAGILRLVHRILVAWLMCTASFCQALVVDG